MAITIRNWSSFQSYKDRKPPWIRLHKSLLDNFEYQSMTFEARALLPMLWLLASEDENPVSGTIRFGYERVAFRLRMEPKDVERICGELVANGFIDVEAEQVTYPYRKSYETVTSETETEAYTETEAEATPPFVSVDKSEPPTSALEIFNTYVHDNIEPLRKRYVEPERGKGLFTMEQMADEFAKMRAWVDADHPRAFDRWNRNSTGSGYMDGVPQWINSWLMRSLSQPKARGRPVMSAEQEQTHYANHRRYGAENSGFTSIGDSIAKIGE